jgi:uncharacterized protein YpuA (DUF1002 family)
LEKNLNYNLEEQVQNTIIELALETENSLRHLEIKYKTLTDTLEQKELRES